MHVIRAVRTRRLEAGLIDPLVIANARLDRVRNVAVEVELDGAVVGVGEIGTLPPITAESQKDAEHAVDAAARALVGADASAPESLAERLADAIPTFAATRAGVEEACWDAVARAEGVPLWRRFAELAGSGLTAPAEVVTDITLPFVDPERAGQLAASWRERGFRTLKIKVGGSLADDVARLERVVAAFPAAGLVLDANEGWSAHDALVAVRAVRRMGGRVVLLEQPVPRDDDDASARVQRDSGVPVCADEACRTEDDVRRIARNRLAACINVKLAKSGVVGVLRLVRVARELGLKTMIGAMVETRIGTGFAAHLAAGLGGFHVIDLDTSSLMSEDPVVGGTVLDGPVWRVADVPLGHGGA